MRKVGGLVLSELPVNIVRKAIYIYRIWHRLRYMGSTEGLQKSSSVCNSCLDAHCQVRTRHKSTSLVFQKHEFLYEANHC
jgi:hypothetical protein